MSKSTLPDVPQDEWLDASLDPEEFDFEEQMERMCNACVREAVMQDVLGFKWCAQHAYRAEVSTYGKDNGFPHLPCFPYAIAPGEYDWRLAIGLRPDDVLYVAHAAIEDLRDTVA